jgi:hypothetical protein
VRIGKALALCSLAACAEQRPVVHARFTPPARHDAARVRLAMIPVESDTFPSVAAALNDALRAVRLRAVDDYFVSKVGLEVVQLSIECVEATDACYTAVGRSLNANVILLARLTAPGVAPRPPAGGRHNGNPAPPSAEPPRNVQVTLTVFNVDTGTALSVGTRTWRSADDAVAGVADLVAETVGERKESEKEPEG